MEHVLNNDGTKVIGDDSEALRRPELFQGNVRFVFFFHYLNFDRTLITPFGEVAVPKESELPLRLSAIQYEPSG